MGRKLSSLILFSLCLMQLNVSLATDAELDAFKKAIRAKYNIKEQAFANNDPEPILNQFYSADVISTDFEGNTHIGTKGLRPVYEDPMVIGGNVKVESFHPHVKGNAGWDWANFHVTPGDPNEKPFTFKILFLWEKINGEWWCKGDMYTFGKFEK
jgi:hypothetical protein